MPLIVQPFPAGPLATNAYLVADPETSVAILVDAPPGVATDLLAAVAAGGYRLAKIVITHAHWDHIADAAALRASADVPLAAHPLAQERLAHPARPSLDVPIEIPPVAPDEWLAEGDQVTVGDTASPSSTCPVTIRPTSSSTPKRTES